MPSTGSQSRRPSETTCRSTRHSPELGIVSQGMHRDALVDARCDSGGVHRPVQLPSGQRIDRILAGKQPPALEHLALRTGVAPPGAQALEQHRRKHGVAILVALALLNAQDHALAVDIADLQRLTSLARNPAP